MTAQTGNPPPEKPQDHSARFIGYGLSAVIVALVLLLLFVPLPVPFHAPLLLLALCLFVALIILQNWRWAAAVAAALGLVYSGHHDFVAEWQHCGRAALVGPALSGDARAQYELGMTYRRCIYDEGSDQYSDENPEKARDWLLKAAESGYTPAQEEMGQYYFESDPAQAAYWFLKAAEAGDAGAQFNMARYYDQGVEGIPPDAETAYFWSLLAAKGGVDVESLYGGLGDKLTPERRAAVQAMADSWKKK